MKRLQFMLTTIERLTEDTMITTRVNFVSESGNFEVGFEKSGEKVCENYLQYSAQDDNIYLWNEFLEEYKLVREDELEQVINLFFI